MPFMATLMLADSAQAVDNKLYVLGGGWSVTGPAPTPSALAIAVKVPWDQLGRPHRMRIELLDSDGHPVHVAAPVEAQPLVIESEFQRAASITRPSLPCVVSLKAPALLMSVTVRSRLVLPTMTS